MSTTKYPITDGFNDNGDPIWIVNGQSYTSRQAATNAQKALDDFDKQAEFDALDNQDDAPKG